MTKREILSQTEIQVAYQEDDVAVLLRFNHVLDIVAVVAIWI